MQRRDQEELPAPPDREQHEPGEPEREHGELEDRAVGRAAGRARAVPHVPHLPGHHAGEVERLLGQVALGVLAADLLERGVALEVGVLGGHAVEQRRHGDPAQLGRPGCPRGPRTA